MVFDVFIYAGPNIQTWMVGKSAIKMDDNRKDLDYFSGWFSKNAAGVLWLSRFIPDRFTIFQWSIPIPFISFMLHFIASTLLGPILGFLAYLLGQEMMNYYESYYGYIPQHTRPWLRFVFFFVSSSTNYPAGRRKVL